MRGWLRILLIGVLHSTCYLWLLPKVILPRFGSTGSRVTVAVLIVISLILLSGLVKRRSVKKALKRAEKTEEP